MGQFSVELLKPALEELSEIADFHMREVGPVSAQKITDKLIDGIERLTDHPFSCPFVADDELKKQGYRSLIIGKYICIYKVIEDTIFIYHIVHGAREYTKLFFIPDNHPLD